MTHVRGDQKLWESRIWAPRFRLCVTCVHGRDSAKPWSLRDVSVDLPQEAGQQLGTAQRTQGVACEDVAQPCLDGRRAIASRGIPESQPPRRTLES